MMCKLTALLEYLDLILYMQNFQARNFFCLQNLLSNENKANYSNMIFNNNYRLGQIRN